MNIKIFLRNEKEISFCVMMLKDYEKVDLEVLPLSIKRHWLILAFCFFACSGIAQPKNAYAVGQSSFVETYVQPYSGTQIIYDSEEIEALNQNELTTNVEDVLSIYDELLEKLESNQEKQNIAEKKHNKELKEQKRKETIENIVNTALNQRGKKYVWGAEGPDTFDCSGLMQWSFAQHDYTLPRVAADQAQTGKHLSRSELKRGDMVFFKTDKEDPDRISHVGLYLGNGKFVHAPRTGDVIKVSYLSNYSSKFAWGVRVVY